MFYRTSNSSLALSTATAKTACATPLPHLLSGSGFATTERCKGERSELAEPLRREVRESESLARVGQGGELAKKKGSVYAGICQDNSATRGADLR